MKIPTHYYGLLHVASDATKHVNLRVKKMDPIDVYLRCASLCSSSIVAHGGAFSLITNSAESLRQRCLSLGIEDLSILSHQFDWSVPPGSAFYSAHFKLELIQAFATGQYGHWPALIDIDTVMHRPLDPPDTPLNSLLCYDISEQIFPAYLLGPVSRDLNLLAGEELADPRWFGGEFIAGSPESFASIAYFIGRCWPKYTGNIASLHHVGDEMVTSAAINLAVANGQKISDLGQRKGIARWWTSRTRTPQKAFSEICDRSILHLPADKPFLAGYPTRNFDGKEFIHAYRVYARRRLLVRRAYGMYAAISGKRKQYVASL